MSRDDFLYRLLLDDYVMLLLVRSLSRSRITHTDLVVMVLLKSCLARSVLMINTSKNIGLPKLTSWTWKFVSFARIYWS